MPNPKNIEKYKMKKGQTLNPNGRPPKLLRSIMNELAEQGYEPVKAVNVVEAYEMLLSLDEAKLKATIEDKEKPMLLRIVAKAMLTPKGFEILEKMIDRAHGKPKQLNEHTGGNGGPIEIKTISQLLDELS